MGIKEKSGQGRSQDVLSGGRKGAQSLQEAAATYRAEKISAPPSFSTEDALARLDAASEAADKRRLGAASLRKIWPIVFFSAGAAIILAISAGLIWIEDEPDTLTAASAAMSGDMGTEPFVLVSFDNRATITDITKGLEELGLKISAGPLPGGVYRVTIPAETGSEYDSLAASLEQLPAVGWLVAGRRPSGS
jgi:hypothetical protein